MTCDVLIIGSGIAALAVAEKICHRKNVMIITKKKVDTNNSTKAQGGVAVAITSDDSPQKHFVDTLRAGCDHNDYENTYTLVEEGPSIIQELIEKGMRFDCDEQGQLELGMEGAHDRKRILHAGGDATGYGLFHLLWNKVKDHVTVIEDCTVLDLLVRNERCHGVRILTKEGDLSCLYSDQTVVATGGIGALYQYHSNANTATGDGIAMAYRAGCKLSDMEFIQFHPTLLYVNGESKGLISEAVRGEGALLVTEDGRKIMEGVHELKDLAPRDVVARTIFAEKKKGENIYLDISMITHFQQRFPTIFKLCEENGIHITDGKLPVSPGAHFFMGGIEATVDGCTNVDGLYAVGEVACTHVHGANRLASNSLLECLVFGNRVGEHILLHPMTGVSLIGEIEEVTYSNLPPKEEIQQKMMEKIGIVRTEHELSEMKKWIESFGIKEWIDKEIAIRDKEKVTVINMLTVAYFIVCAALARKESVGAHYRSDFPQRIWKKGVGLSFEQKANVTA
ncbi:MAG: L-aspartate oxidase [Bacillaceae bacterium]